MNTQAISHPTDASSPSWLDTVVGFLVGLGETSDIGRRATVAQRLFALTDAELATRGLSRDRVLHHAFGPYLTV